MDMTNARDAVRALLYYIEGTNESDDLREGLEDTPERVVSMFEEIFSGYKEDEELDCWLHHKVQTKKGGLITRIIHSLDSIPRHGSKSRWATSGMGEEHSHYFGTSPERGEHWSCC